MVFYICHLLTRISVLNQIVFVESLGLIVPQA